MAETVHVARLKILQKQRPKREAHLEGFAEPLRFGMHGGYSEFYRLPPSEKLPTTVDHLLASLAG